MHLQSTDSDSGPEKNPTKGHLQLAAGYAIGGICLAWVLYHIHPKELINHIRQLKWQFCLAAILIDNGNYVLQGLRWRLLLHPIARVRTGQVIQATYVALFTNNVLPMRFGEVARAYLITRWYDKRFPEIVPSMVVEHFMEGIWLAIGIGLAAFFLPLPHFLSKVAQLFEFGVILLAVGFIYAFLRRENPAAVYGEKSHRRWVQKIGSILDELLTGTRKIGLSTHFFLSLTLTLASLLMQALALWFVADAFGLQIEFWKAAVVLLILRLGVVIPSAPANIGTYQFSAALGLELFGMERSVATGFSLVLFFVLMVPTWITGSIALSQSGLTLLRLRQEAQNAAKAIPE
jgi:glycosyltransferase 2 family protein